MALRKRSKYRRTSLKARLTCQKKFEEHQCQVPHSSYFFKLTLGHNNQVFDPTTKVNQEPAEFSHDQKVTTEKSRVADKLGMNMVFPTFDDAQPPEYEIDMPNLGPSHKDGLKVYGPKDEKPMETKGM